MFIALSALETPAPAGLGPALWIVGAILILAVCAALARWRRGATATALRSRLSLRFAATRLGTFVGFRGPTDGRKFVQEIVEAVGVAVYDDFSLALENSIQPAGCLLVITPFDAATWIAEHHDLTRKVINKAVQSTLDDAYVEANAKAHPGAGRDHRSTVRAAAQTGAPRASITIGFLPSYGEQCAAVFAGSAETATMRAKRIFGGDIPTGATAQEFAAAPPLRAEDAHADDSDWITQFEQYAQGGATRTAAPAPAPTEHTRSAAQAEPTQFSSSIATEPVTPVTAVLTSGSYERAVYLRSGHTVGVGRSSVNELVVPDDLSVSGTHLRVTVKSTTVELVSSGKTGTWITNDGISRMLHSGVTETVPLPVSITLGDARKSSLTITESGIR